jgi:hypothetical protein
MSGLLLAVGVSILTIYHTFKPRPERTTPTAFESRQLQKLCREIGKAQARLDELNRMLIDIDLCSPDELVKSFRCAWESGGMNRQYDFFVDGCSPTSEDMRRMVSAEAARVERQIVDLADQIVRLRLNHYEPETLTVSAGEGSAYARR